VSGRRRLATLFAVLALALLVAPRPTFAAPMTSTSVTLSDTSTGAQPSFTFTGVAATTITSGSARVDNVTVQFSPSFTGVNAGNITTTSIVSAGGGSCNGTQSARVCVGGVERTVTSVAFEGTSAVRINFGDQSTTAGSTVVAFTISANTVTNPSSSGAYGIQWYLRNTTTIVDDAFAAVQIGNLTYTLGSTVPTAITFAFNDEPIALVVDPGLGATGSQAVVTNALTVSTNAPNGFIVSATMPPLTRSGGSETIARMNTDLSSVAAWSLTGNSQFGISRRVSVGGGAITGNACGATNCGTWLTSYSGIPASGSGTAIRLFTSSAATNNGGMDLAFRIAVNYGQPIGDYASTVTYTVVGQ
jgi:hypothetical protein